MSTIVPGGQQPSGRSARRRAAQRRSAASRPVLAVSAVVALLMVVALTVDVVAGPRPRTTAEPVEQGAATSGTWYCPSVGQRGERAVITVTAVGDAPSRVIVQRYDGDTPALDAARVLRPGRSVTVPLEGRAVRSPIAVSWSGGPATASWRIDDDTRTAAAPCEAHPSELWHVPGFSTVLGSASRLHLFNPFPGDAVVRITFGTPRGHRALALSDNIVVPALGTKTLNLAEFQPQVAELAATVEVLVGRVVAQGELVVRSLPRQPGTPGRTMLPGARAPAQSWSFAYARVDESSASSWLQVYNPGERPAAVEVRVSSPRGRGSSLLGEMTAPPGAVTRVELSEASRDAEFGVDVEVVNSVPVVVSRKTALSSSAGASLSASLGATERASEWSLPGAGTRGRDGVVAVYNPGGEPAVVDFIAAGAPRSWSDVRVPPNGRAQVLLSDAAPDVFALGVLVRSEVPVVAELRSLSDSGARLWTAVGIPSSVWLGPPLRPPVQLDPGLATRVDPQPTEPSTDLPGVPPTELMTEPGGGASDRADDPAGDVPVTEPPPEDGSAV